MARNQTQFQKGMSFAAFQRLYGTEELCHEALVKMRWRTVSPARVAAVGATAIANQSVCSSAVAAACKLRLRPARKNGSAGAE